MRLRTLITSRTVRLVAAGAMAVGIGACGSSGSAAGVGGSGGGGASSSSGGSGGSGGGSITLGELGPLTGSRADIGTAMVTGSKLALSVINANGGVLGHHVNLDPQDDANDPADAVPATDKEINSDHVAAIVGPIIQTAPVVLPLAAKANIPMLMWGGGAAFDNETSPYFFRLAPSDTEQADAMIVYAHQRGFRRVALAIGNTTGDTSLVPGLKAAAKKLGMTITTSVTIAVGSTSFRSEISNLFSGHPQAIVGQFDIPSAGVLFGELKQQNLLSTPWVVSNLWFAKEFFTSVGPQVAHGPIYIANPGVENGGYSAFLRLLKQRRWPEPGAERRVVHVRRRQRVGARRNGGWDLQVSGRSSAESSGRPMGPEPPAPTTPRAPSMLKAHKSIKYVGAASATSFDTHHNVYGPFDVLHYNSDGSVQTVAKLSAEHIKTTLGQ